ncbi:unnamed protein product [Mytilus coruscus]|uniref:HTH CENPB-type domain-containing protein n=1 Tax=Mytilus coruscus TaxID=42192 RepID=A0A6J8D8D4_MYTCO|nr:unnamed protein product [Mytilus coruscus]
METPQKKRKLDQNEKPSPSPKRARKELSIENKMNLIKDYGSVPKISQKDLSLKYGIGKATVCNILKRKDTYRAQYEENIESKRKRHASLSKFSDLNELLFRWFKDAREMKLPLSGPILQEKAMEFAQELNLLEFKASNGWLESWRLRYMTKLCKEINVLKAIHWIKKSWNETKSTTIESCLRDAGFPLEAPSNVDEPEDPDDEIPLADLVQLKSKDQSVQITEINDVDDNLATEPAFDCDWESDLISEFTGDPLIESDDDVVTDISTEVQPGSDMNHTNIFDSLK